MADPLAITNEIWRKWDAQKIKPPMSWIELRKKVETYIREGKDPLTLQTEFVYETAPNIVKQSKWLCTTSRYHEYSEFDGVKGYCTICEGWIDERTGSAIKTSQDKLRWINTTLANDEVSTDEELIQHFMKEGKMDREEAAYYVSKRSEVLKGKEIPYLYVKFFGLPWPNPEPQAIIEESETKTFAEWLLAAVKRVWNTKNSEQHWEWLIEPTEKGVLVGLRGVSRPHEFFPKEIIEKYAVPVPGAKSKTTFYFQTTQERERARELLSHHNFYFPDGPEISLTNIDDPDYMLELLDSEGFITANIMVE